ncbi:MAG: DUF6504 family protein [Limnochordia bacterium]|jgi:hypothetical protein|nr:hypothetical protein [Bacillota bacterium]
MKVRQRQIEVLLDQKGEPASFSWSGRREVVAEIIDKWWEGGRWWAGEREMIVYRLLTRRGGLYEIHFHSGEGTWWLARVFD